MTLTLAATQTIAGIAGAGSAITYTLFGDEISGTTDAFKVLQQGTLPASAATLYTATSVQAIVKVIALQNVTAGAVTVSVFVNGTANTNKIWSATIPANGSATYDGRWTVYDASGFAQTVGATGPQGLAGTPGTPGTNGDKGWSPVFNVVADGARRVLQLADWTGGTGTKPGNIGDYVSASGFTAVIANAVDIRGPAGSGDVSSTLTLTAGAGLTGGGTLAANRTFDIVAADASITVNPDSIQVGVLQSDAQHGNRGGGGIHANVVAAGAAGFMTGADKTKLDGIAAGANVGPPTTRLINTTAPLTGGGDLSADRTLAISPATGTSAGSLSANDKRIIDDLHYDIAADFGWIGNDANDNGSGAGGATAFSAIMTALPSGARLFFPAGTYRTSVELTINVDKRITFQGVNRYSSVIKTTSATAHIFHKNVAGWYDTFIDLGFQSSVTKTAGAAINISAGNNVGMNVYRCWMTGMFWGINADGSQSANLSVWSDLDISGVANGGRGLRINGDTINLMIHNATINAGAATTSACCEIRQSGAVQVSACDWIMGTNVVLIDSSEATGAGPQACYFTNCFFDQPQQDVVKIVGTRTANRIKFTQCGIATSAGGGAYSGVLVAGTGAGGVGTQTALPAGISIFDCDIYHQAGNGTGAGIRINGAQDVNIQGTRVTGWGGAGGIGIRATPSAGNQTSVRINGCIIGPNSNLTITNSTGVQLDAGNFARVSVTDNGIYGWTVGGIVDNSTTTYTNQKNIADNDGAGLISGTVVSRTTTLNVAATETEVIGFTAAANMLKPGLMLRIQASGIQTNTATASTSVHRIRIGPVTLTGPIVGSWSSALGTTARTNVPFYILAQVLILTATTAIATITVVTNGLAYAAPTTTVTAAVTIATNADQRVQLTTISGAASTTWNYFGAEIQAVIP